MYAPVGLLVAGLVLGTLTLAPVQRAPQFSTSASVPGGTAVLLAVTWLCLAAAAAHLWRGTTSRRAAVLLGLAGLSWLIPEWDNPSAPPALYAAALLLSAVTPALVLHSALTWRDDRSAGAYDRTVVATGYVIVLGLLGLAPALVFDPAAMGCFTCPPNPWLVREGESALALLERLGGIAALVWLCLAVGVLARAAISERGRLSQLLIQLPALGLLEVLAVREATDLGWGLPHRSLLAGRLWLAASLTLAGIAVCALWILAERRRALRSLGLMLVDLARGQQPGLLRDAFAERLGDPTLELVYPTSDGAYVDARGRPIPRAQHPDTALDYAGTRLGVLLHSSAARYSPGELDELVAAMHLALEREGLTARALSEERELRESGFRLLLARDAERRRLERDLHDGAQQRLLGTALGLQLLGRTCPGPSVEAAQRQLKLAIEELRVIAQGLAPPVLVDAGLEMALHALAETRDLRLAASGLSRYDPTVELTAYQLVESATRSFPASVAVEAREGTLHMRLEVLGGAPDLTIAADRSVTLGGRMSALRSDTNAVIEVDLPAILDPDR